MEISQDQIYSIIGMKEVEIIVLKMQLAQAMARIKELDPAADKAPLKVVDAAS